MGSEQRVSTLILLMMFIFWIQNDKKEKTININKNEKELVNNQKYLKRQKKKIKRPPALLYARHPLFSTGNPRFKSLFLR